MEDDPLTKYFSFIVLGLVLCIGYVMIRAGKKPKPDGEWRGAESALQAAEREARGLKKPGGDPLDDLGPNNDREAALRQARRMMEESQTHNPPPPTAPEDRTP